MSKRPRPKYLTNEEIKDLMEKQNSEIFADSDSECEEEDENNVSFSDESDKLISTKQISTNEFPKAVSGIQEVSWYQITGTEQINKLSFTGMPGLIINSLPKPLKEIDYFDLFFSTDLLEVLVCETNTYANQQEGIKSQISKNLHSAK